MAQIWLWSFHSRLVEFAERKRLTLTIDSKTNRKRLTMGLCWNRGPPKSSGFALGFSSNQKMVSRKHPMAQSGQIRGFLETQAQAGRDGARASYLPFTLLGSSAPHLKRLGARVAFFLSRSWCTFWGGLKGHPKRSRNALRMFDRTSYVNHKDRDQKVPCGLILPFNPPPKKTTGTGPRQPPTVDPACMNDRTLCCFKPRLGDQQKREQGSEVQQNT